MPKFIITVEDGVPFAEAKQAIVSTGVTIIQEMPFLRMFVVETSTGTALSGLHSALAGIVANIEPDGIATTQ